MAKNLGSQFEDSVNFLMETDATDVNGCKSEVPCTVESPKVEDQHVNGEEDSESNSLLPPRRDEMLRKSEKTRRKVQWNDKNGNKLAEVLEFDPR